MSISKIDLKKIIDINDYFNKNIPLIEFEITELISPYKHIKNLHLNLFRKYDNKFDENILEIYYDCIFGLNSYDPHYYINCREEMIKRIKLFNISTDFIANYNYCYNNEILEFNQIQLNRILNSFFMNMTGFKPSILKKYLSSKEFLLDYLPNIEKFLNNKTY